MCFAQNMCPTLGCFHIGTALGNRRKIFWMHASSLPSRRERERELFGPKKRGPKPETFLLKAKAKEKTYEFRRESPRGIQVSYPIPEPVITPRAREGLRTVVPTIFPPSSVNRGESFHVRPPESERRPRPSPALIDQKSLRFPKKRGRKPKLYLHHNKHDASSSVEPDTKRSRLQEEPTSHGLSKLSQRLHHPRDAPDHSLVQLTKRFQEETTITPKSSSEQRHVGGAGRSCAFSPYVRKSDQDGHRTYLSRMAIPQPNKVKHPTEQRVYQFNKCCALRELARAESSQSESTQNTSALPSTSWTPSFTNLDTVTVTDVTMNSLTVTIRESSTDKGFFKDKR
ncbi:chromobox protein homolog 8a isoform X2 [Melanotaenia boesemani]|uniref:chromobox protein homolog 8a isoform X2 n=1 Tax=Melanotaenia boesemani TaxID=1250792 RepID=UPI001C052999|nr:chromobox protein homolog 8a isoform X2 [Melanotaenia boesemani]